MSDGMTEIDDDIENFDALDGAGAIFRPEDDVSVRPGDEIDITAKEPTLRRIRVATGWDVRAYEGQPLDLDLVTFLLDRTEKTRIDEDFIFYNNMVGCDGSVRLLEDNRTGDLIHLPFDILKITFVISIYDAREKEHDFTMVKNCFIRIVNEEDGLELLRYNFQGDGQGTAIIVGTLIRNGANWIFQAGRDVIAGGLPEIAKGYGLIVT
jgi:tellurium resistance protein TerD